MRDLLLRAVRNPAVRRALIALVVAVLAAFGISLQTGCGGSQLPPAVAKARTVLECQIAVLESLVPESVAHDLVMAARAGNARYVVEQLIGLGITPEDIRRAGAEFHACSAPPEADDAGAPPVEG